ncbi:MAG TPA: CBS domain-containing protein [Stellaceae bacterium]|nr:CBS domain-containing protein [Stellaceae bacterium]
MNVETILKTKGAAVVTIAPSATIAEAVALLTRKRIGALVVSTDGREPLGILSERDIVHGLGQRGAILLDAKVDELMTRSVITCAPQDRLADLMALMTERRIRHLPVLDDGRLAGLVSIGDVVKNRLDEMEWESSSLKTYIAGAA